MGKVRRGNYVFVTWRGDHPPRHVHVYRDGKFLLKWDLDNWLPMKGHATARILKLIRDLVSEGLEIVEGLPILALSDDVAALVKAYEDRLRFVGRARADLLHIAFAVAYETDYLVTWNCRHIASGETIRRLARANAELRRFTPVIVTPEELLESGEGDRHD